MRYRNLLLVIALGLLGVLATAQQDQHQSAMSGMKHEPAGSMMSMGEHQQMMSTTLNQLRASFEKIRSAKTPEERQAAIDEHGKLLQEFQQSFEKHHTMMAEHMKSCPMMQHSGQPGQEKPGDDKH